MVSEEKISTGAAFFDAFLEGGYEKGVVTTIYGPSGSGKTNLCLLAAIRMTGTGKRILYIDTESSFSVERLKQVTKHYEKVLDKIIFFRPSSFDEQKKVFADLIKLLKDDVGLIVVDTISMLYRLELGQTSDIHEVNTALAKQIAILIRIARVYNLPVLVANQVYADFHEKEKVNMVGGDILRNGSRCLIELKSGAHGNRIAFLRKHRSMPESQVGFVIKEKGIEKR
jgi:DNA repair protein RadB